MLPKHVVQMYWCCKSFLIANIRRLMTRDTHICLIAVVLAQKESLT